MLKLFKNKKKTVIVEDWSWYADYRMEDGQTGRVFSDIGIDTVERIAIKRGHKAVWFSVNGGEWFNSFKYNGD